MAVNSGESYVVSSVFDTNGFKTGINDSTRMFSKLSSDIDAASNKINVSTSSIVKGFGAIAGINLGISGIREFSNEVLRMTGLMQGLSLSFETMLGTKQQADQMMMDVKEFALSTPYTITETATIVKQLIAMNAAGDDVMQTYKALGDVAAGLNVPISRIAINFGQVAALGRLQQREIRDFAMAGVPIYDALNKVLGKTNEEITAMVRAGQVGFPDVLKAFQLMSGEGGQFNNMMEKLNSTVTGQMNRLKDQIEQMFAAIGESNTGLIYGIIGGASNIVGAYKEIIVILEVLIKTYGAYWAAQKLVNATSVVNQKQIYNAQILELEKLIVAKTANQNADLKQLVADKQLTVSQAQRIAALRAEITAETDSALKRAQNAMARIQQERDITAALIRENRTRIAQLGLYDKNGNAVISARTGQPLSVNKGSQEQLDTAYIQQNTLAKEANVLSDKRRRASIILTKAEQASATAQLQVDTAIKNGNTAATGILSTAMAGLGKIFKSLWATMKANPFAFIAAGIMFAFQAVKKFTEAQEKLSDASSKLGVELANEAATYNQLLSALKNTNDGSNERAKVVQLINQRYKEYLPSLITEKDNLNDVITALNNANIAMSENIRLKIKSEELTRIETEKTTAQTKVVNDLVNTFAKDTSKTPEQIALFASEMSKMATAAAEGNLELVDIGKILKDFGEDAGQVDEVMKGYLSDTGLARRSRDIYSRFLDISKAAQTAARETQVLDELIDIEIPVNIVPTVGTNAVDTTNTIIDVKSKLNDALLELERVYRQSIIDLMDEGIEKELKKIEEEYRRKEEDIIKGERELAALRGAEGLTAEDKQIFANQRKVNSDQRKKDEKAVYEKQLADFKDFETEAIRLVQEFYKNRAEAIKQGRIKEGSSGDLLALEEFDRQMNQMAEKFSAANPKFQEWSTNLATFVSGAVKNAESEAANEAANKIINDAIANLEEQVKQAEQDLKKIMEDEVLSTDEAANYGKARAEIQALNKEIEKLRALLRKKGGLGDGDDWKKTYSTLQKISKEFNEIGDAIGGTTGKSIVFIGNMTTGILQAAEGMKTLKLGVDATGQALSALDKASVILAVISAGIKIISGIANVFKRNTEEIKKGEQAALNFARALHEIDIQSRYDLFDTVFGNDALGKFKEAEKIAIESLNNINIKRKELQNWRDPFGRGNPIEATYDGRSGWQKFWGTGDDEIRNEYFNIDDYINTDGTMTRKQLEELDAWIEQHYNNLDDSEKKWIDEFRANGAAFVEAAETQKKHLQDLFGNLSNDIASSMVDAFIETGNAAEHLGDIVDDVAKNMAKSILSNLIFSKYLDGLEDDVLSLMNEGDYAGAANLIKGAVEGAAYDTEMLTTALSGLGIEMGTATNAIRNSASQGFAQASQESIDAMYGVFINIENNVHLIRNHVENNGPTKDIQEATNTILNNLYTQVIAIKANTDRLENIENYVKNTMVSSADTYNELRKFNR